MDGAVKTVMVDVGPMERALGDLPQPADEFMYEQDKVARVQSMPSGDLDEWLDSLSSMEARRIYSLCDRVAGEHRRRAEVANLLQSQIRQRFADTAQCDLPKSESPSVGRG